MKKDKFAKGLCFYKYFWLFIIGSVIGAYYEQILHLFKYHSLTGIWEWSLRRGVIYGPFNIIYGLGAALMVAVLVPKKKNWKNVLISGSLLGGLVEYGLSYLQETFTGTVSWDYTGRLLNINGRTTIPYMLFWGLLSLMLVYTLYPFFSKLIEKIPYKFGKIITNIFIVLMALDMFVSFSAVIRQSLRHNNIPAFTVIGRVCDKYYTDDFLKKYYPNMHVR